MRRKRVAPAGIIVAALITFGGISRVGTAPGSSPVADANLDTSRVFPVEVSRSQLRSFRAEMLADANTTTTTVPATTTTVRPRPTTTTTHRRRPTTTTTATTVAPAPAAEVVAAAALEPVPTTETPSDPAERWKPPEGCMGHGAKSKGEMHRCWDGLVARWSWPNVSRVFSVMTCESHGNPWAHNSSGATGLMQILDGRSGPYDPWENMVRAWAKSNGGRNWSPWSQCL